MRHRISGRKLNRSGAHRLALRRNLAKSLIASFGTQNYVLTTREKAKFARPFVEKLITLSREKTLHRIRRGIKLLQDKDAVRKLFDEVGPAYKDRPGGYTRILATGRRRLGDKASVVLFGFVFSPETQEATVVEGGKEAGKS